MDRNIEPSDRVSNNNSWLVTTTYSYPSTYTSPILLRFHTIHPPCVLSWQLIVQTIILTHNSVHYHTITTFWHTNIHTVVCDYTNILTVPTNHIKKVSANVHICTLYMFMQVEPLNNTCHTHHNHIHKESNRGVQYTLTRWRRALQQTNQVLHWRPDTRHVVTTAYQKQRN